MSKEVVLKAAQQEWTERSWLDICSLKWSHVVLQTDIDRMSGWDDSSCLRTFSYYIHTFPSPE